MLRPSLLITAPAISMVTLAMVVSAGAAERFMRNSVESEIAYAIVSDDGQEFDVHVDTSLSQPIQDALSEILAESEIGQLTLSELSTKEIYQETGPDQHKLIKAYLGRTLTNQNRHEEALTFLSDLRTVERTDLKSAFAYAESLNSIGRVEEALLAYQTHIEAHPNHQAGHINFAILLSRLGETEKAQAILRKTLNITNGTRKGKTLALLGVTQSRLGQFEEAAQSFKASISYRPTHGLTWRRLAEAQAKARAISKSMSHQTVEQTFSKADSIAPGNVPTKQAFAKYYFSVGLFDDALPHHREATTLSQNNSELLLERSLNLLASERPAATRSVIKRLKKQSSKPSTKSSLLLLDEILNGSKSGVLKRLSRFQFEPGDSQQAYIAMLAHLHLDDRTSAGSIMEELPVSSSYFQPAQFALARYDYHEGKYESAIALLTPLVAVSPDSSFYWLYLGRAYAAIGAPDRALNAHKSAYDLYPESGKVTIAYSRSLMATGATDEAIESLFDHLDNAPRDARVLLVLADAHRQKGDHGKEEQVLRVVYDFDPTNGKVGRQLIHAQLKSKRLNDALSTVDELILKEPAETDIRILRAEILTRMDRVAESEQEFERILKLEPGHREAKMRLRVGS